MTSLPFSLFIIMSTPSCKLLVATPTIAKGRKIVLSSPSQDSEESDSDGSWTGFEDIAGAGPSPSADGANLANLDPRVQEGGLEVEGGPSGV